MHKACLFCGMVNRSKGCLREKGRFKFRWLNFLYMMCNYDSSKRARVWNFEPLAIVGIIAVFVNLGIQPGHGTN